MKDCVSRQSLQREKSHPCVQFIDLAGLREQIQVFNHHSDLRSELVREDDSRKMTSTLLPLGCECEEVIILGDENTLKFRSPLQQTIVVNSAATIFLRCQYVDTSSTQS